MTSVGAELLTGPGPLFGPVLPTPQHLAVPKRACAGHPNQGNVGKEKQKPQKPKDGQRSFTLPVVVVVTLFQPSGTTSPHTRAKRLNPPLCNAMATSAAPSFSATSPLASMNPTMTEHDYRFPRRPAEADAVAAFNHRHKAERERVAAANAAASPTEAAPAPGAQTPIAGPGNKSATPGAATKMTSSHFPGARYALLPFTMPRPVITEFHKFLYEHSFTPYERHAGLNNNVKSYDEMQTEDSLNFEIWKLFARTKQLLPNQARLSNMTWRRQAIVMAKQVKMAEEAK